MLCIPNRVKETTITTGTGTLSMGGAVDSSHVTLVNGCAVEGGDTAPIMIDDGAGNWEACWSLAAAGTPDTATRGALIASSTGARINFGAGTKTVSVVPMQQLLLWAGKSSILAETDVASAATCNIGAAPTLSARITGTTAITNFGNQANAMRFVRFAGALTLTHNAASLILPTGDNIYTSAGDTAIFMSDSAGNWRCLNYQPAAAVLSANGGINQLTSSVAAEVVSLTVPAGRWRIRGRMQLWGSTGSSTVELISKLATTSADTGSDPGHESYCQIPASRGTALALLMAEVNQAAATTWYMNGQTIGGPANGDQVFANIVAERIV